MTSSISINVTRSSDQTVALMVLASASQSAATNTFSSVR